MGKRRHPRSDTGGGDPPGGVFTPGWSNPLSLAFRGVRYLVLLGVTLYLAMTSPFWEGRRGRGLVRRLVLQQVYFTAVQALPLILTLAIGFGALAMIQASVQLTRFGMREVEGLTGMVIFRELAPILVCFIVIARSATAIVVEIGNMRVNGEILALEVLGINLDRFILFPRIIGMVLSVPLLTTIFVAAGLWGGYSAARASGLLASSFVLSRLTVSVDVGVLRDVLIRSFMFGLVIGTVACHHGLQVRVSATEVPQQTTRGIISALAICFILNLLLSLVVL